MRRWPKTTCYSLQKQQFNVGASKLVLPDSKSEGATSGVPKPWRFMAKSGTFHPLVWLVFLSPWHHSSMTHDITHDNNIGKTTWATRFRILGIHGVLCALWRFGRSSMVDGLRWCASHSWGLENPICSGDGWKLSSFHVAYDCQTCPHGSENHIS